MESRPVARSAALVTYLAWANSQPAGTGPRRGRLLVLQWLILRFFLCSLFICYYLLLLLLLFARGLLVCYDVVLVWSSLLGGGCERPRQAAQHAEILSK